MSMPKANSEHVPVFNYLQSSSGWSTTRLACATVFVCGMAALGGCQETPQQSVSTDPALADPFGYKVDVPDNISGGKIHELDKKALQGDLDRMMNP